MNNPIDTARNNLQSIAIRLAQLQNALAFAKANPCEVGKNEVAEITLHIEAVKEIMKRHEAIYQTTVNGIRLS